MKEEGHMNVNMGGHEKDESNSKYFIQKESLVPKLHFPTSPTEKKRTKVERGENGEKVI